MKANMNSTTTNSLDPVVFGVSSNSIAAVVDVRDYGEHKKKAILAHRSQVGPASNLERISKVWGEMFFQEKFVLGGLRGSFPQMPLEDLLEGL
jgi:LmbE family N-acetylglucosaminyl deacetylase